MTNTSTFLDTNLLKNSWVLLKDGRCAHVADIRVRNHQIRLKVRLRNSLGRTGTRRYIGLSQVKRLLSGKGTP